MTASARITEHCDGSSDERGAVLLEWAIVSLGLLVGLLIFYDTGTALLRYMSMVHVAGEGVRTASKVPELKGDSFTNLVPTEADKEACASLRATTFPCGHNLIQERMRVMIATLYPQIDLATVEMTTEFVPTDATGTVEDDTVIVELAIPFEGLLLSLPLSVTQQGPYLFNRTS